MKNKLEADELSVIIIADGRTVIGEIVNDDDSQIAMKNPAVINCIPNGQDGYRLQVAPLYWRDLLKNVFGDYEMSFNKSSLISIMAKTELDHRVLIQYQHIFATEEEIKVLKAEADAKKQIEMGRLMPKDAPNQSTKVVNMFEDEPKKQECECGDKCECENTSPEDKPAE